MNSLIVREAPWVARGYMVLEADGEERFAVLEPPTDEEELSAQDFHDAINEVQEDFSGTLYLSLDDCAILMEHFPDCFVQIDN